MPYRLVLGDRTHISEDYTTTFETPSGQSPWGVPPSEGGGIPEDRKRDLPSRLIIQAGYRRLEFGTFGSDYFTATDEVKLALEKLDPRLEFYPLELVDLVQDTTGLIWLLHSPHRVQVINLEANGDNLVVEQSPPKIINGRLVEYPRFYRIRAIERLVLDKRAIAGLHLWSGTPTSLSRWFCSDELKEATEKFRRSFYFETVREA